MAHNANTLQLGTSAPALKSGAFSCMTCAPGKVAVEMAPAPTDLRGILLPERVGGKLRPDIGTVMSCAPSRDKNGRDLPMSIKPGDGVLVRPYDGMWIAGFEADGYKAEGEVRLYGLAATQSLYQVTNGKDGDKSDTGLYSLCPWSESIVARIVGQTILPTEGNLLVRPIEKTSSIFLPDSVDKRSSLAVVEATCPNGIQRCSLVAWVPDPEMDLNIVFDEDNEGLWLIRMSQVLAVVEKVA